MNASGHLNFAIYSVTLLGAGFGICKLGIELGYDGIGIFIVGAFIGLKLPDCDHPNTPLGKISPIPWLHKIHKRFAKWRDKRRKKKGKRKIYHKFIFKHGGITHTIFINLWIFIIATFYRSILGEGIAFGYMSHIYIDHITGNKLSMLWWPVIIKRRK